MGKSYDVAFANSRLEELEDVLIHTVDHGTGLGQQHDLVLVLDLSGHHHRLLPIGDMQTGLLKCQEHGSLSHVHAQRFVNDPLIAQGCGDLVCEPVSYTHLRAHETDSYLVCRL